MSYGRSNFPKTVRTKRTDGRKFFVKIFRTSRTDGVIFAKFSVQNVRTELLQKDFYYCPKKGPKTGIFGTDMGSFGPEKGISGPDTYP